MQVTNHTSVAHPGFESKDRRHQKSKINVLQMFLKTFCRILAGLITCLFVRDEFQKSLNCLLVILYRFSSTSVQPTFYSNGRFAINRKDAIAFKHLASTLWIFSYLKFNMNWTTGMALHDHTAFEMNFLQHIIQCYLLCFSTKAKFDKFRLTSNPERMICHRHLIAWIGNWKLYPLYPVSIQKILAFKKETL